MNFVEYPDQEMMMIDLADTLAGELNSYLMHNDFATFAVPGGTTPGPIFDTLSGVHLDWARVRVLLSDERWVPEDHPRSNTRLVRDRLLVDQAAAAQMVGIYQPDATPQDGAAALARTLDGVLPISVLLLGMGADMHTASLFPGAAELAAALDPHAPAALAITAPGADEPRVTLSLRVLKDAMACHIVITGAEKRAALERAQKSHDPLGAPISGLLAGATVHWAE